MRARVYSLSGWVRFLLHQENMNVSHLSLDLQCLFMMEAALLFVQRCSLQFLLFLYYEEVFPFSLGLL
jgi:hypothetical protein